MLSNNADPDKYYYSGYRTGFDSRSLFSYPCFNGGKNVVIFWLSNSSLVYIDEKRKDILVLPEGLTQGLDGSKTKVEAKYPKRKFCSSLHYKGSNSFLFVNVTKIYYSKVNGSETKKYPLSLGNISNNFSVNNTQKNGIKSVRVYFFCWLQDFWY